MPQISIAEPVTQLKKVRIVENGEPLVNFLDYCPKLVLDRPRFTYRRETVVRKSVAEMLAVAAESIPKGYKLAVVEGWRAPLIQQRMYRFTWNMLKAKNPEYSEAALRRLVNRYTAPMNLRVPPPHTTGAAVDLALLDEDGNSLDMSSPYETFDARCFRLDAPGLSDQARLHRKILSEAVIGAGITNYPSEYWHYSFGDQGWAYRGEQPNALYGAITPDGWEPDPKDISEEPLTFAEDPPATRDSGNDIVTE